MKKLISLLPAVALLCLALIPPPPPVPTNNLPKKKQVLHSPKALSLLGNDKRMASALAPKLVTRAMALPPASGMTFDRVLIVIADTDGTNVLSANQVIALRFTAPNPTQGPYVISASPDLQNWTVIRSGAGLDPLTVYDFSYLTTQQTFFCFQVNLTP